MSYLPTVAWRTLVAAVYQVNSTTYDLSVAQENPNDPGASTEDVQVGYYLRDYVGHTYTVSVISVGGDSHRIRVTDDLACGVGPQQGYMAFIYKSVGDGEAPYIAPIQHRILDSSAIDYARPIELDIIWKSIGNKKMYHGVQQNGALSFNNTSHVITIAAGGTTYWYKGVKFITTSAITCDIDDFITLTTNTQYYLYFDDATGTFKCSTIHWDLKEVVPVCTVFWNGSAFALQYELHNHLRDLDWHIWAHSTIGARYDSGFNLTAPTTSLDSTLTIETGVIRDEDQAYTTGQLTTMRGWYLASAVKSTFADYALPYLGTAGAPVYLRTSDYTLQTFANSDFACYWVYASLDKDRPCYITPTHDTSAFNTIALARANTAPVTVGMNSEMKLLYKLIYSGNGEFQEMVDYRTASSIPGGGVNTINAGSVSATATSPLTGNNVQVILDSIAYLLSLRYTPPFTYSP